MEEKFLEEFNEQFGTQLKESKENIQMILRLFHDYIEQTFKTNELCNAITDKILDIEDRLHNSFTNEQKELFSKWEVYRSEISNYTAEQAFAYGYFLNKELLLERGNIIKTTNETEDKDINIGTEVVLKDGRKAIIQEFVEKIIPSKYEIVGFDTDIGYVRKDEIKQV